MDEPILRRGPFIAYLIIVVISLLLTFTLKMPWEQNIRILLNYYKEISLCFSILTIILIPFRLYYFNQKGMPKISKFHFLGPTIDLTIELTFEPLIDASFFYSAMFLLFTIFKERATGLWLDSFLVLLIVAGILLFQSISDLLEMGRDIFYVRGMGEVNPE